MRVVVQQQQRFFRDGLAMVLDAEPDITVVATAATDRELLDACRRERPDAVVFELGAAASDPLGLAASLRRIVRASRLVATTARADRVLAAQALRAGVWAVVPRDRGVAGLLEALRSGERPPSVASLPDSEARAGVPPRLTARERQVLALVAAGHTGREIAATLGISAKTVENHKQRIFAKLGVQNQAHAIAVAMRSGLLDATAAGEGLT